MKKYQLIILGPKLQAVLRNKESANWPKMEQFEKFSTISHSNSKFNEKISHYNYFGPHIAGRFENTGSANWPKMDKLEKISIICCTKSKLKGESV